MPEIKSVDQIAKKWSTVTPQRQQEYVDGVVNTTKDWAASTAAAVDRYKKAMQASLARDSFKKGVLKAGTAKWRENTAVKGPGRWAEGVAGSKEAYQKGFAPYADTIKNTSLPARGPVGDPSNIQRVSVMAKALHDKKLALQGG